MHLFIQRTKNEFLKVLLMLVLYNQNFQELVQKGEFPGGRTGGPNSPNSVSLYMFSSLGHFLLSHFLLGPDPQEATVLSILWSEYSWKHSLWLLLAWHS